MTSLRHTVQNRLQLGTAITLLFGGFAAPTWAEGLVGTCAELPDRLEACEPHTCTFTHPFTGGEESRSIVAEEEGECIYRESMPNDGLMECRYDESTRKDMAAYYREAFEAERTGAEPPDNALLNTALADGTCEVSGY